MVKLYWKFFLGFWLAMLLMVFVTAWSVALLSDEDDPALDRWLRWGAALLHWQPAPATEQQRNRVERDAAVARQFLQDAGRPALVTWLRTRDRHRSRLWVLGPGGHDLLGRPLPPLLRQALRGHPAGTESIVSIEGPDGAQYRVWRAPYVRSYWPLRPEILAVSFSIAVLISGILCWVLARYLTRPIQHLQAATQRLAAGDLSSRVRPRIGGRRRDEIAQLGEDFDRMAERLERLLTAQRQLLQDVSHELRSPLARLQVALSLARRRSQGAAAELDRIELEAGRLEDMIGQLLSLLRLESGQALAVPQPVELAELLQDVARDAAFEAQSRQRQVVVLTRIPCTISGDREVLRSALENLVRNAVRHTPAHSTVELSLAQESSTTVLIRVRDYGPGVAEADLPRLFDPFFRVEQARDRTSGGFGLGMAIAARAVRAHGGEITARNVPDGGLEVVMRLSKPAAATA